MLKCWCFFGALLVAAPLLSQAPPASEPRAFEGKFMWFGLTETRANVQRVLGTPLLKADFGDDFHAWQYRFDDDADHEDFSHHLVFRKSTGALISLPWIYSASREFYVPFRN